MILRALWKWNIPNFGCDLGVNVVLLPNASKVKTILGCLLDKNEYDPRDWAWLGVNWGKEIHVYSVYSISVQPKNWKNKSVGLLK